MCVHGAAVKVHIGSLETTFLLWNNILDLSHTESAVSQNRPQTTNKRILHPPARQWKDINKQPSIL